MEFDEAFSVFVSRMESTKAEPKLMDTYIAKTRESSFREDLLRGVESLLSKANRMDSSAILSELNSLADRRPYADEETLDQAIASSMDEILSGDDIIRFGGFIGESIGGFTLGEMSAIGGRPGWGKTNTLVNIMDYMAANHPEEKVLIISREMSEKQLMKRLLLVNAGGYITYEDMRTGKPLEGNKRKLAIEVLGKMQEKYKNVIVRDEIENLDDSVSLILKHRPTLVMDDFLQLIVDEKFSEDKIRFLIGKALKTYKWLAKKLKCHIINFSQLNRNIEDRMDGVPQMSDFYESGLIEILCELCVIMKPSEVDKDLIYYILKARHGKVGVHATKYEPAWCKINLEGEKNEA